VLFGLLCLMILSAAWWVERRGRGEPVAASAWRCPRRRFGVAAGAALVLLSNASLLLLAPWARGANAFLPADATSHAKVAAEIAAHGLGHGWLESYLGGFPLGHHYPPLGWLLLALGMRAGLGAASAVNSLGFVATLAAPLTLYAALTRAGARSLHAACGGCFLALVCPYNPFVGGFEVYFMTGLVSQVLALPLCIAFAAAAARGARGEATLFGALAMSAHPQVAGACVVLVAVAALIDGARGRRAAVACSLGGALIAGAALYGQGVRTLRVPFGWPTGLTWRQLGFGTSRLSWWFRDGDLLDQGATAPVLTALVGAAALTCLLLVRRRAPRGLLLLGLAALALSASGPTLLKLAGGAALLEVVQPLRVLALLPPLFATLLSVALEEGTALTRGSAHFRQRPLAWLAGSGAGGIGLCLLSVAVPARLQTAEKLRGTRMPAISGDCPAVPGFERAKLTTWFRSLRGGSLWLAQREGDPLDACVLSQGLELQSAVPLGNTSAVGSHVGLLWQAAKQLQPARAGAARRASALGVGYLLQTSSAPKPDSGFVRRNASGSVELWENPAAGLAHVGCVRERWTGSDRALRERLSLQLDQPEGADRLLDPEQFTELVQGSGEVRVEHVERSCSARSASLSVLKLEPGVLEAQVQADAPLDLVFSVTAFPGWRLTMDGAPVPSQVIAPGYVAVHVERGRHRVLAAAGTLPGYGFVLGLGALAVAALAWLKLPHQCIEAQPPHDADGL